MAKTPPTLKPGQSTGSNGGIYTEIGPRGGQTGNNATIADNRPAPPTSKPNHTWKPVHITPSNKK